MRRAVTAALIALTFLVTGCSQPGDASPQIQSEGQDKLADHQDAMTVLRDALNREQLKQEIYWKLVQRCMAQKGFNVHPNRNNEIQPSVLPEPPYSSPTTAEARDAGYGIGGLSSDKTEPRRPSSAFDQLSAAEQSAYFAAETGVVAGESPERGPDGRFVRGGCQGEAHKIMFGQGREPVNPVYEIEEKVQVRLRNDPELKSALAKWSSCIEEAGYPKFRDPSDARRYAEFFHYPSDGSSRNGGVVPQGGPWPFSEARKREVALATADATCADKYQLREVHSRVWSRELADVVASLEPAVVAYSEAMDIAIEKAQHALGKS